MRKKIKKTKIVTLFEQGYLLELDLILLQYCDVVSDESLKELFPTYSNEVLCYLLKEEKENGRHKLIIEELKRRKGIKIAQIVEHYLNAKNDPERELISKWLYERLSHFSPKKLANLLQQMKKEQLPLELIKHVCHSLLQKAEL
jgi:hypothetical protein